MQNNFVSDNLNSDEYMADFSENYTCIVQDAIQSYHWNAKHVTIHPFLCAIIAMETGIFNTNAML